MLPNTRRTIQILWQMLYQRDMPSFLNLEPKFLDLKTYLNFIKKIKILHPLLLSANTEHKEVFIFPRGIYLKKENFTYPKEHVENSLLKKNMKEESWAILELIKLMSFLKRKFFCSHMRKDVQRHFHRCISCLITKSKTIPHVLYTHLPFASAHWEDISMNFILGFLRT